MKYIQVACRDWPEYWNDFLNHSKRKALTVPVACEFDSADLNIRITCSDSETLQYLIRPFSDCRKTVSAGAACIQFPTRAAFNHAGNYLMSLAYRYNGKMISEEEID